MCWCGGVCVGVWGYGDLCVINTYQRWWSIIPGKDIGLLSIILRFLRHVHELKTHIKSTSGQNGTNVTPAT